MVKVDALLNILVLTNRKIYAENAITINGFFKNYIHRIASCSYTDTIKPTIHGGFKNERKKKNS